MWDASKWDKPNFHLSKRSSSAEEGWIPPPALNYKVMKMIVHDIIWCTDGINQGVFSTHIRLQLMFKQNTMQFNNSYTHTDHPPNPSAMHISEIFT